MPSNTSTPGALPYPITADTKTIVDEFVIELNTEFSDSFEYILATVIPNDGFSAYQYFKIDIVTWVFIYSGWDNSWTIGALIDYSKDGRVNLLASVRWSRW